MNDFIEKPVGKLYARFLPSAIFSLLIQSVASLIDTIVVSFFMGPVALSAINICMPIYSILTAVALLIVGGAGTLYSQYMGQNNKAEADKIFTLSAVVLLIIGIIYMAAGVLFTGPIVRFLGANDAVYELSCQYGHILFYFVLINIFFPFLQMFVRIDMDPLLTVISVIACAFVNLCLDILFIGPFLTPEGFGTTGAAYATCIAYCVGFAIMAIHFFKKKNTLRFVKSFFSGAKLGKMIVSGIPASITLFGTAITMTVFNNFIIVNGEKYGAGIGELYVSVYSVVVQVLTISMAVYVGIAQCAQPIIAANYGAGLKDRVRKLFRTGMIIEVASNLVLTVILFFAAEAISGLFSMDKGAYDMTSTAVLAIRIFAASLLFTGINQMILYLLQTTNYIKESSVISFLSGTLLLIVGIYVLAGWIFKGNIEALGVWLSYIFAQGLTLIYSLFVYFRKRKVIFNS